MTFSNADTSKHYLLSSVGVSFIALIFFLWKDANSQLFVLINSALPWQMFWMTLTNSADFLCIGSLLFIFLRNNTRLLICAVIAGLAVHLSVHYSKHFFALPRPEHVNNLAHLITLGPALKENNYAMPSGHTAGAFMVVVFIIKCYSLKGLRMWGLLLAATFAGISRITVGAHWPADVFAGASLGIFIGYICSHEKLNLQHAGFKYFAYLVYLIFIVFSVKHVARIHSESSAMSEGIIVFVGIVAFVLWMKKIIQEVSNIKAVKNQFNI